EKLPGREAGPDWSALGLNGPSLQRKRNGPRPVSRIVAGIGGQRRREAGAGGSRPLDASTTAGMDVGDSSGRRWCFAVVDRDLTGA
ncbi:hypothetical protein CRG98_041401, partial [Punica granatum]